MSQTILTRLAAVLAVTLAFAPLATRSAHSTAYTFSETYDHGSESSSGTDLSVIVTGSFEGTANGNLITNLSGFTLYFNGVEAADPSTLFLRAYNLGGFYDTNAVLSFDGLANNFLLSDSSDPATSIPSIALSSFTGTGSGNPDIAYNATLTGYNNEASETILVITEAASVPEPASLAILALGVTLLLVTRRATWTRRIHP